MATKKKKTTEDAGQAPDASTAGAIVAHVNGGGSIMEYGEFEFHTASRLGLIFKKDTPEEYWLAHTAQAIAMFEGSRNLLLRARLYVGDALNFGEGNFKERYAQAIDGSTKSIRLSMKSLINDAWIAGSIPVENRREMLTMSHHEIVARLKPDDQKYFLDEAESNEWTVKELKDAVNAKFPRKPKGDGGAAKAAKKATYDFAKLKDVIKALEKISEVMTSEYTADLDKEDTKALCGAVLAVVEQFGDGTRYARLYERMAGLTANFLDDTEEQEPIKEWIASRKKAWQPHLKRIVNHGRRLAVSMSKEDGGDGRGDEAPEA